MKSKSLNNYKNREVSNKKNIVKIIMGVVLLILAGIEIVVTVLVLKKAWMTNLLDALALLVFLLGVIVILFGIIDFVSVKRENEYLRNLPYRFDYQAEAESYKMIGKKIKKKFKFAYYEKFSLWKLYIEKEYADRKDNEDFYRFLNRKLREKRNEKELILNLMIPLDITILTAFISIKPNMSEIEMIISMIGLILFLVIFLTINMWKVYEEIYFLDDFMSLVFPKFHIDVKEKSSN